MPSKRVCKSCNLAKPYEAFRKSGGYDASGNPYRSKVCTACSPKSSRKPLTVDEEVTQRRESEAKKGLRALSQVETAKRILIEGLKYHEYDGHDMPKRVAREALEALGVKQEDQP